MHRARCFTLTVERAGHLASLRINGNYRAVFRISLLYVGNGLFDARLHGPGSLRSGRASVKHE
jgi:hypothetical protein